MYLYETGEICLDVLRTQWSPAWTISTACTAVQALLESPEPDSPLNIDAGMYSHLTILTHQQILFDAGILKVTTRW